MTYKLYNVNNNSYIPKFGWLVWKYLTCCVNDLLDLSKTRQTYSLMNELQWTFGQKLLMPGSIYWATDTQYMCPTSETKFVEACVLMHQSMCPYTGFHMSLSLEECVLMHQ